MKQEIVVVAPIPPELRERLSAKYTLIEDRPEPGRRLVGMPVAVTTSMAGADKALMESLPDLELIACNGTGMDRIDLEAARERGITVQNTPDVVTEDTADCAIGLMYAVVRRIAEADRFVRSGKWKSTKMTPSRRLYSRHVGIVGLGRIGQAIARRAIGIGMKVSYTGPNRKDGVKYDYLGDAAALAAAVDIIVLCCPATDATRHLINAEVITALGRDGYIVNVSRGSVIDESALIAALEAGTIAGAGLDVFEGEPNIDPRFAEFENVVLQPHIAAVTKETRYAIADILETAIDRYFENAST